MKKFIKWFCLFITYGFIIAVLQANNASNNTITLCSAALLVIIFLLWKFKKNKKETPQENHTETLNKEYGKTIIQVTHSEASAQYGDLIINLKDGVIMSESRVRQI